jgi:hypothetical protein
MVAFWKDTCQSCFGELTLLDFVSGEALDALAACVLEVLANIFI